MNLKFNFQVTKLNFLFRDFNENFFTRLKNVGLRFHRKSSNNYNLSWVHNEIRKDIKRSLKKKPISLRKYNYRREEERRRKRKREEEEAREARTTEEGD